MERTQETLSYTALCLLASLRLFSNLGIFEGPNDPYRMAFGGSWAETASSVDTVIQNGGPVMLSALQSFVPTGRKMTKDGPGSFALSTICMEADPCQAGLRTPLSSAQNFSPVQRYIHTIQKM